MSSTLDEDKLLDLDEISIQLSEADYLLLDLDEEEEEDLIVNNTLSKAFSPAPSLSSIRRTPIPIALSSPLPINGPLTERTSEELTAAASRIVSLKEEIKSQRKANKKQRKKRRRAKKRVDALLLKGNNDNRQPTNPLPPLFNGSNNISSSSQECSNKAVVSSPDINSDHISSTVEGDTSSTNKGNYNTSTTTIKTPDTSSSSTIRTRDIHVSSNVRRTPDTSSNIRNVTSSTRTVGYLSHDKKLSQQQEGNRTGGYWQHQWRQREGISTTTTTTTILPPVHQKDPLSNSYDSVPLSIDYRRPQSHENDMRYCNPHSKPKISSTVYHPYKFSMKYRTLSYQPPARHSRPSSDSCWTTYNGQDSPVVMDTSFVPSPIKHRLYSVTQATPLFYRSQFNVKSSDIPPTSLFSRNHLMPTSTKFDLGHLKCAW